MSRDRRRLLHAALRGAAALAVARHAVPAAAAAPAELTWHEPGRIATAPLLAAPFTDLQGRAAPWKPGAGRAQVLNFWARWCAPCRVEIPELIALQARGGPVDVLGIALDTQTEAVRDFARAYEISYPLRLIGDGGLDLLRALGNPNASLPFTLVLDRQGAVLATRLGVLRREHLDAALQRALGKA